VSSAAPSPANDPRPTPVGVEGIVSILRAAAEAEGPPPNDDAGAAEPSDDEGDPNAGDDRLPSDSHDPDIDHDIVAGCAGLDHSDTDNGLRLRRHFGQDLLVMAQEGIDAGAWAVWDATHWNLANGAALASLTAQKVGARIGMEAGYLGPTPEEGKAIEAAAPLRHRKPDQLSDTERTIREAGAAARAAVEKRRKARRSFAVSSKNLARIKNMLATAAPHLRRQPDAFNANPLKVATLSHTLTFGRALDEECPDPAARRFHGTVEASATHNREDLITALMPVAYDPAAACPRWDAFLAEFLPDAEKRRTVQCFTGLGLLGVPVQKLMFHYGSGANGKSVFLETITRVMGESFAVSLPAESIAGGGDRKAGGPSPDLERLYGKRMLRVSELPSGKLVDMELVKRLTGGERIAVRTLFKGYFEFMPRAKVHWSGNDKPGLNGGDYATFRRLLLVHWNVTIPQERRRDIEEVVGEFVSEGPGILNWLIAGALDYLATGGVYVAASVEADTEEYRRDSDPMGRFFDACVVTDAEGRIQGDELFQAYVSFCMANGLYVPKAGKGLFMQAGKRFGAAKEIRGRSHYMGVRLHSVPDRPTRNPFSGDDGH
jgi:putative DNA primase/helicase